MRALPSAGEPILMIGLIRWGGVGKIQPVYGQVRTVPFDQPRQSKKILQVAQNNDVWVGITHDPRLCCFEFLTWIFP